jgi:broad specificity phosphatase PhoE
MLLRIEEALWSMVETAHRSESGCIAAVTHSSYLRMLLATVEDVSLLTASTWKQANCCVNVLDFDRPTTTTATNGMRPRTSGRLLASVPFLQVNNISILLPDIKVPSGRVIRVNEMRHLGSL